MSKRKIVFVSPSYTNPYNEVAKEYKQLVSEYVAELNSHGIIAFSPITYGHTLLDFREMSGDWEFWKEFCTAFLEKSDEMIVYQIPDWEHSKGIKEEIKIANELGLNINYKKII